MKYQPLTRMVELISLSRFLHELLHRREIRNGLKPGLAPLHVTKFLQLDYFLASGQFNGAYAAP
jgi:hypothetical protein